MTRSVAIVTGASGAIGLAVPARCRLPSLDGAGVLGTSRSDAVALLPLVGRGKGWGCFHLTGVIAFSTRLVANAATTVFGGGALRRDAHPESLPSRGRGSSTLRLSIHRAKP
jgi:NAD(P)-dependent dehydrogenase (short-subunit alcohol dehydrogenase family)